MNYYSVAKKVYGYFLMALKNIVSADMAKLFDSKLRFHRTLHLKNPQTLSEKVCWLENHENSALKVKCTDKWDVRAYVASKGLSDLLVPVYGTAYTSSDAIPFQSLPERYVVKATHGCKMNYFCKDKAKFDIQDCKATVDAWLDTTYGAFSAEWHYLDIPHRVYIEQYLDDADKMIDYKFHCFNGIPEFILALSNRDAISGKNMKVTIDMYDMDWNNIAGLQDFHGDKIGKGNLKRPKYFDKMKEIARILSKDFQFVRVDLYEINGKIYFGELTFTPACGIFPYFTDEFDREMGKKLKIL